MSVQFRRRDAVAQIVLDRPDRGNAIDLPLAHDLLKAAITCDTDDTIRCVQLTGAGRMFCVGGDVAGFAAAEENTSGYLAELAGILHLALQRFAAMRKPLIVAVNGPAAGAGMSLALAGDIVLAAPVAHFTTAYTAIGLTPDGGLSWALPRLVGLRRAQELLLTNRRVSADEAAMMGMITRVEEDAASRADAVALDLSRGATRALGGVRSLLRRSFSSPLAAQLEAEAAEITQAGRGEEAREGIAAFAARRPPIFSPH